MPDALTVRWDEWTRYDPQIDAEVVCLLAFTGRGTFNCEVERGSLSELLSKRKLFREYVVHAMEEGRLPSRVEFGQVEEVML